MTLLSRRDLVGRGMLWRVGFEFSKAHASLSLCLLPVDENVKLSATVPVPCLSASCCDYQGLTL